MLNIHLYPSPFQHESRILREAHTLSRLGIFDRIDLVGMGAIGLDSNEEVGGGIWIRRLGLKHPDVGLLRKITEALSWSLMVYRKYRRSQVACINCHSLTTLPLGCVMKWAMGAQLIYDAHELETETVGLRGVRKISAKIVERVLIRFVDYSIFVGTEIAEWYRNRYSLINTAVVFSCPAYQDIEESDHLREVFGISPEMPIFLYQGLISAVRGLPELMEAFVGLKGEAALVFMGYGDLVPWVQDCAKQHSNIFYHPAVPPDQVLRYTSAADYGLSVSEPTSLSYDYSMPNKFFEYVMAGKPVLVSQQTAQRTLIQSYDIGEVMEDSSPASIREAALRLISRDSNDFARGIDRFRRDFSWERQEATLQQIYLGSLGFRPMRGQAPSYGRSA